MRAHNVLTILTGRVEDIVIKSVKTIFKTVCPTQQQTKTPRLATMSSPSAAAPQEPSNEQQSSAPMQHMAATTPASAQQQQQPPMDFASILAKIQSLEKEKADMRAQLENVSGKLSKLQESKRAEMEQMMNSTITKWLENLETKDAAAKLQLKEGLNRLVQQGDESGVWNVIACASSSWVHNVGQIEQLTSQLNEYKVCVSRVLPDSAQVLDTCLIHLLVRQEKERLLSGGIFQAEESRVASSAIPSVGSLAGEKRRYDDIGMSHGATAMAPSAHSDHDIWSEFQSMMMSVGGNRGVGVESCFQGPGQSQAPQQHQ